MSDEEFGKLTSREQSLSCLQQSEADDNYVCDVTALREAAHHLEDATVGEIRAAENLEKIIDLHSHVHQEKRGEVHHAQSVLGVPRKYKAVSMKAQIKCHIVLSSLFPSITGFNEAVFMMLDLGRSKMTVDQPVSCFER